MVPLWSTPNASELPTAPQPGPLAHQSAEIEQSPAAKSAQTTRDALMNLMSSALLSLPALEVVNRCIYLYMQYTFPMAPIVHEPTLRKFAVRYFGTSPAELFRAGTYEEEVANMRSFALLTGLCASVASVIPESLLSYRYLIAQPFLDASREVLRLFEDYDVEYPSSASIATRIFHTVALQHITGKARLTYHILGQAALIVSNMRLYSEKALKVHEALECQLLRHVYWQIYAADQASACLRNRPFHLHELLYDEEPTICSPGTEPVIPQLDITQPWYNETVEGRLLIGFHFIPRLWSSAAKVILDVRAHGKRKQDADKKQLTQEYMDFLSIMDGLPYWLQAANIIAAANDEDAAQFQKTAFWVQRCTIQITFQCLRLVILQQCIDSELWDIMGLNGEPLALQLTKIGIVHDFVQTLDDIPFIYLQVKGEPTVRQAMLQSSAGNLLTFHFPT